MSQKTKPSAKPSAKPSSKPSAKRAIVSLVPSLTETVGETALRDSLNGVTQFCSHPKGLHRTAAVIGGTKDPDLEAIAALKPSHVLVNDEENKPEHIEWLARRFPTLVTSPTSLTDVPAMLADMAHFLASQDQQAPPQLLQWREQLSRQLEQLEQLKARQEEAAEAQRRSFLYFIWREPYMVAGPGSYISSSIELAGLRNHHRGREPRYPELAEAELAKLRNNSSVELWLSSEPYPFRNRDIERLRPIVGDDITIRKVDGRLHSWYGYSSLQLITTLLTMANPALTDSSS